MMHLGFLLGVLGLCWGWRSLGERVLSRSGDWIERWQRSLGAFVGPPLLLLMTLISLAWMGPQGQMVGLGLDQSGFLLNRWVWVLLTLVFALGVWQVGRSLWVWGQVRRYPVQRVFGQSVRVIPSPSLWAGQVGLWRSQVLLTQGIVQRLDPGHVQAVIWHEQAHSHYRDLLWFWGLGWIRRWSGWLPHSESIWQELLELRELRADAWAAQHTDPLQVAEALFQVAQAGTISPVPDAIGMDGSRLVLRIESLLSEAVVVKPLPWHTWGFLALTAIPLLLVPLHG